MSFTTPHGQGSFVDYQKLNFGGFQTHLGPFRGRFGGQTTPHTHTHTHSPFKRRVRSTVHML